MTAIAERVAAGAAFLDEHDPDWWQENVERAIDLDRLRLSNPDSCVLGQRCPVSRLGHSSPYRAYAGLLSGTKSIDRLWEWAEPLGFTSRDNETYPALTAEWKRVITARREAAP